MTRFMNYEIAMAVAADLTNRRMLKAGRKKWNRADWNAMCDEFNRLWPLCRESSYDWSVPVSNGPDISILTVKGDSHEHAHAGTVVC